MKKDGIDMRSILTLIRWGIRGYFLYVALILGIESFLDVNAAYIFLGVEVNAAYIFLGVELVASGIALLRFTQDQWFQQITGFVGNQSVGYYGSDDMSGTRALGWLAWLVAIFFRFWMIYFTLV